MVNGIGGSGAGRAAIEAALKELRNRSSELGARPSDAGSSSNVSKSSFAEALKDGLSSVESKVDRTNEIHLEVLEGKLDLHEVAAHIKESEVSFQFALQVRNKLLDAYREVMRMSV